MKCLNCEKELAPSIKFCTACGTKVVEVEGSVQQIASTTETTTQTTPGENKGNAFTEQATMFSKGFGLSVVDILKKPHHHVSTVTSSGFGYGITALILFSLIIPIAIYNFISSISFLNIVLMEFEATIKFGDIVPKMVVQFLIIQLIILGVIFLVLKIGRVQAHFKEVVARYGGFMIIPVAFALILLIAALLNITVLFWWMMIIISISTTVALFATIYSYSSRKQGGLDLFYLPILAQFILAVLMYFYFDSQLTSFFNDINEFTDMFGRSGW
ncbi:zinc ribbon domain-containing protein [Bacillus sp. JCM 19041]|uniref:zinc ribbon domain-containing protein n=1 Tax=Bacillus sp. JCM 19041 TaxID=1460637 RepID=UPI0006CFD999